MANAFTFANREVCDLTICDYTTQRPIHVLDYANATTQEISGEQVYAYGGRGHPRRVTFYGDKGGTLTVETQMMTSQLFSIATGASIETTANFIKRLELTSTSKAITVPEGTTFIDGSVNVYHADDDCGTPVEATYSGSTITLTDGEAEDGDYIVYGVEQLSTGVEKMSIKSTTLPKNVTIYGETLVRAENGQDYPYRMVVYNASPQQTFNFGFANNGDPATITLTFDLLADEDDNIIDLILIDEAAE